MTANSSDSIDYILAYTATDNTCEVATAAPTIAEISGGDPIPYLSSGTQVIINPLGIDRFLGSPTSGNYYIGLSFVSTGLTCQAPSSVSAHCGESYDATGPGFSRNISSPAYQHLCIHASYTRAYPNGLTLSQIDNGQVYMHQAMQYLYVADNAGPDYIIRKCGLNSDGSISVCTRAENVSSTHQINDLVFQNIGAHQYAYLVSNNGGSGGGVSLCSLATNGSGNLTCSSATVSLSPAPGWETPSQIAFATFNGATYAYVGDVGAADPDTGEPDV